MGAKENDENTNNCWNLGPYWPQATFQHNEKSNSPPAVIQRDYGSTATSTVAGLEQQVIVRIHQVCTKHCPLCQKEREERKSCCICM